MIKYFEKLNDISLKSLEAIKTFCFFILFVDIFLIWWYLKERGIALAILISIIIILAITMYLMNRRPDDEWKEQKKPATKPGTPPKPIEKQNPRMAQIFDDPKPTKQKQPKYQFGIPDSDTFNKNVAKAFGA